MEHLDPKLKIQPKRRFPAQPPSDHIVFDLLGLTVAEREIMRATWENGKTISMICREPFVRRAGIKQTSVPRMLRNLYARKLMSCTAVANNRKSTFWKCELPRMANKFRAVAWQFGELPAPDADLDFEA